MSTFKTVLVQILQNFENVEAPKFSRFSKFLKMLKIFEVRISDLGHNSNILTNSKKNPHKPHMAKLSLSRDATRVDVPKAKGRPVHCSTFYVISTATPFVSWKPQTPRPFIFSTPPIWRVENMKGLDVYGFEDMKGVAVCAHTPLPWGEKSDAIF